MKHWLVGAFLYATAALASAQGLSLGTGFDYTSGNYGGSQSTDTLYIPFYARYESGPLVLKLTVPYLKITGPGNVVGAGGDRVVVPGRDVGRRTESGLGDMVGSAFYNVLNENNAAI